MFDKRIVEEYAGGKSLGALATEFGSSLYKVRKYLVSQGVEIRTTKETARKYKVNNDYFAEIDSAEKAYWLGFFFADGYVNAPRKHSSPRFGMSLSIKDINMLEMLKKDMESTYPIHIYSGRYSEGYPVTEYGRIVMASEKIFDDLHQYCDPVMKTLTLEPPRSLPEIFESHFIRGYFDGDGSASTSQTLKIRFDGTEKFVGWVAEKLSPSRVYWSQKKDCQNDHWQIEISRVRDVYSSYRYMYRDATRWMPRKRRKIEEFLTQSSRMETYEVYRGELLESP